ncbi:DUF1566 domain-containing protein [Fundidesulfovibrio butyratiphilus]
MKHVGDCEVMGLLGRGGEGLVYKVRMPVTGRLAALKLFHPTEFLASLVNRDELLRRFLGEARIMGRLEHDNIVQVLGVGQHGEDPYCLLEYFCRDLGQTVGESWRVEAGSRPQPLPRAVGFVLQTLSGLARLHYAGLVHRDIKPANLLLDAADRVKIADFGLSALRGEIRAHAPGLKVGSPFYAAPEQERDPDRAGPQADLYSAAMVLHRLLFGCVTEEPPTGSRRPSLLSPDMDRQWDQFFASALSPDPAERPASAKAMAARLSSLMDHWRERLGHACALPDRFPEDRPETDPDARAHAPRNRPAKARDDEARRLFGLDELFRPLRYARPDFHRQGAVVFDRRTGLAWQWSGCDYPLDWFEAAQYVEHLDRTRLAGLSGWRLPTVDELSGLLTPPRRFADHCVDDVFDPQVRLLWSADRRTFTQAWCADAWQGAFCPADTTCRRYVRAVSDGRQPGETEAQTR